MPSAPQTEIAIAVVEHNGSFLVGRRPAGVPLAGMWEFPGGKVHPGELPAVAAVRECLEETGLAVQVLTKLSTQDHAYDHARLCLHFYSCQPATPAIAVTPPFRWVLRAELARFEFPAANQIVLRQLLQAS